MDARKDTWAYDDDDDDDHAEEASEESSSVISGATRSTNTGSGTLTLGKKSRLSVLGTLGGGGDKKKRDHGVEKRGNMSKVGLEVEILPDSTGEVIVSSLTLLLAIMGGGSLIKAV